MDEKIVKDSQGLVNDLVNDCISRQAAIDVAKEELDNGTFYDILSKIESLPSAQPERKRGRWIYGEDNPGTGRDGWFCSECEHFEMWDYSADMKSAELNLPNYCPSCGADMREDMVTCDDCRYSEKYVDGLILCRRTKTSHRVSATSTCGKGKREVEDAEAKV